MTNRCHLHDTHGSLGARFVDFGGWEMPVQYEGVLAEHAAVRETVGVFDVSHLGRFQYSGPGATEVLRYELCNDVAAVDPGRAQYTMALNTGGGVEDDIIAIRASDEEYWVLPNGANFDEILARFESADGPDPVARRDDTVMLARPRSEGPRRLGRRSGRITGPFSIQAARVRGRTGMGVRDRLHRRERRGAHRPACDRR